MIILKLKIDVKKIEKERLYHGKKGVYLDAVLFLHDEPDQYGNDGMICQDVTFEQRQAGEKGNILGNARFPQKSRPLSSPDPGDAYRAKAAALDTPAKDTDDIPF